MTLSDAMLSINELTLWNRHLTLWISLRNESNGAKYQKMSSKACIVYENGEVEPNLDPARVAAVKPNLQMFCVGVVWVEFLSSRVCHRLSLLIGTIGSNLATLSLLGKNGFHFGSLSAPADQLELLF